MNAINKALESRFEITDLIYSYCRAMDRMDHQLGYSVWHDDGTADYGPMFNGSGHEFIDWVCDIHKPMTAHSHQVSNILLDIEDDHHAVSESYVTATLRYVTEGQLIQSTNVGRYLDRWSRKDGRWGIDKRLYVHDFDHAVDIVNITTEGWGCRDRMDPSYKLFGR